MKIASVNILEWQINFCKGDYCAASLLSFLIDLKRNQTSISDQLIITMDTIYGTFAGVYAKELIRNSIQVLKMIGLMHAINDQERKYIFKPEVCNSWLENYYTHRKYSQPKENSFTLHLSLDESLDKPQHLEPRDAASAVIGKFLNKYKEISALQEPNKLPLLEPFILETICSLSAMII